MQWNENVLLQWLLIHLNWSSVFFFLSSWKLLQQCNDLFGPYMEHRSHLGCFQLYLLNKVLFKAKRQNVLNSLILCTLFLQWDTKALFKLFQIHSTFQARKIFFFLSLIIFVILLIRIMSRSVSQNQPSLFFKYYNSWQVIVEFATRIPHSLQPPCNKWGGLLSF